MMDRDQTERKSPGRGVTSVAVIVVIALIAVGVMIFSNKKTSDTADTTTTTGPTSSPSTTATATSGIASTTTTSTSSYKDGSYTATGSYQTPGGTETIKVTLTLKSGAVASSTVASQAKDGKSKRYQGDFVSGYKQYVDGKSVDDISLTTVSGSSLTPNGFEDALSKIKSQAKV